MAMGKRQRDILAKIEPLGRVYRRSFHSDFRGRFGTSDAPIAYEPANGERRIRSSSFVALILCTKNFPKPRARLARLKENAISHHRHDA